MSTGAQITFNESEVNAWVQACQHEGALREAGASANELMGARLGVVAGLISLIAPSMPDTDMAPLFALLLQGDQIEQTKPEYEDPIPESILDTNTPSSSESESESESESDPDSANNKNATDRTLN